MPLRPLTELKGSPFRGGAVTARQKALLPFGAYSNLQNFRNEHPGFRKRRGQAALHTEADGTNRVLNLYEWQKGRIAQQSFFAQMDDGDLLLATNNPPTVTTGAFGTEIYDGGTGQIPGSFANIADLMLFANGIDDHLIYAGDGNFVEHFIVFRGSAAPPVIPTDGTDYSIEVSDDRLGTAADISALDTLANFECIFIGTPVPVKSFTFVISNPNANSATLSVNYWSTGSNWLSPTGLIDGTESGGATFAVDGTVSFDMPTAIQSKYQYGANKFWYRLHVSAALDATVTLLSVTYAADIQDVQNIWDGFPQFGVEAQVETASNVFATYATGAVDLDGHTAGNRIMLGFTDPIEGLYIDPGGTPQSSGTSVTSLKYWDGNQFTAVTGFNDDSNGMSNAGWMTFARQSDVQPLQWQTTQYYAFWYELIFDSDIDADVVVLMNCAPYFDITELGKSYSVATWKDRACYTFDYFGAFVYISKVLNPMVLNGSDFGVLRAGDGRNNRVVGMRKFHNELMVWQEEKGVEGGCVTLFEGYSPETFGKLVLSTQIGAMNNKCMVVVDGVLTATATDERVKTIAFWLSRYGVAASDGQTIQIISDDIQNYFDPTKPESIRRGYESEMWLNYDSSENVIRVGLVSGTDATVPNVFPVLDLTDKTWSFDTPEQELSCMVEVSAASGEVPVVQVGGGVDDGLVYLLNTGLRDVDTSIDSLVDLELDFSGENINLLRYLLRFVALSEGACTIEIFANGNSEQIDTVSMLPPKPNQETIKHIVNTNVLDTHITVRVRNNQLDVDFYIIDMGLKAMIWENV